MKPTETNNEPDAPGAGDPAPPKLDPVSPRDRRIVTALQAAIADPDTTPEERAEYREELACIAHGYIDIFSDEEKKDCFTDEAARAERDGDEETLAWARAHLAEIDRRAQEASRVAGTTPVPPPEAHDERARLG